MRASDAARRWRSRPPDSPDFFVSGFAAGAEELGGTAAVIDEPVGDGRAVLFSLRAELPGLHRRHPAAAAQRDLRQVTARQGDAARTVGGSRAGALA